MTQEKLLEIIREMAADNWKNSDLDAKTEKILTYIAENDYEGRDEDLEAFVDRINSARTETPALFIVQDALKNEGWNFEEAYNLSAWDLEFAELEEWIADIGLCPQCGTWCFGDCEANSN